MTSYQNLSRESGVLAYKIGSDYIIVQFRDGNENFYKYTNLRPGTTAVEHMKLLAAQGLGLNSYITTRIKSAYAAKGTTLESLK